MKKSLLYGLVFMLILGNCSVVSSVVSAAATLSPKVKQLVEYAQDNNGTAAKNEFKQLSSKEKDEFAAYLDNNNSEFPPLYYMLMADHIYKYDKDKAVLWYYIGKIRSYEDVLMCKDKTARAQIDIYPMMAPKTLKYVSTKINDGKYIAAVMQKSLDWDKAHPQRVSPIWACYHGMSAFTKEPEIVTPAKQEDVKSKVRKEVEDTIKKYKNK